MQEVIKEIIARRLGKILVNEKISNYTTYKVGGKARAIVYPKGENELKDLVGLLKEKNIKYFVLGNGSNVLFSDKLYDGIIIKLDNFNKMEIHDNIIEVEAGYPLIKLANEAIKNSLAGLEFGSGIPGTIGGAIFMNAGAYGEEMSKIVRKVRILTSDLKIIELNNQEMEFSYRTSFLQKHLDYICLSATLELTYGNKEELQELVVKRRMVRKDSQPLTYPSAGSVFRNPPGMYAGKLIEDMGLKGFSIGKAEVSTKHANFIINKGNAKASDIKRIIDIIKEKANIKYGIKLRVEQRLINWVGVSNEEEENEEES